MVLKRRMAACLVAVSLIFTGCSAAGTGADIKDPAGTGTETGTVQETEASATAESSDTAAGTGETSSDNSGANESAALQGTSAAETLPYEESDMYSGTGSSFTPDPNFTELEPDSPEHPWKEKYNQKNPCRIVFLGDSLYEVGRESDSVPLRVWSDLMNEEFTCTVYNLAMGGTCAALQSNETNKLELWDSRSLTGMVHILTGDIDDSILKGYKTQEIYRSIGDLQTVDYFIIGYGTNDFLSKIPLEREGIPYAHDPYGYRGAMNYAVETMMSEFPNARILVCTPLYAQFFGADRSYLGDAFSYNNGYGTLQDYIGVCHNVASSAGAMVFNGYDNANINVGNASETLMDDGIHLTAEGRQRYADAIARLLLENNDGKG
ncbi:MAG: SGNH/GDSL hydrolase family protein [Lachnospiraceae bacterium]|nr:SGNH/GDSL hydrolase family protein [Lachnospiraceae bacterium]